MSYMIIYYVYVIDMSDMLYIYTHTPPFMKLVSTIYYIIW